MGAMEISRRKTTVLLAASALAGLDGLGGLARAADSSNSSNTIGQSTESAQNSGARWLSWPAERPRPELRLPDLEDQPWDLKSDIGRPVVLNFWASWCEPCRAEMPSLVRLQAHFQARRLKVVAVNFREGREPVRRFRQTQGLALAFVRDAYGEAAQAWGVNAFPTTFVINAAGHPVLQVEGEVDWGSPAVYQRLQAWV